MSFFGGRAGSSTGTIAGGDQNARKLEVMNQVRSELASAHLQELVNKMTEECYRTCKPETHSGLTQKDKSCLGTCSDRFLEAFNVVSAAYVQRLNQERKTATSITNPLSGDTLS